MKNYEKSICYHCRYVYDSFIIIIKNKLAVLNKYLNYIHPRLKFTCEKEGEIEQKHEIIFLDL